MYVLRTYVDVVAFEREGEGKGKGIEGRKEGGGVEKGRERPGLYVICCKLGNESVFFFLHIVTDEGILD